MNKIVVGTNILVSALYRPEGTPGRILDLVINGQALLCYDSRIISEYMDVLARPKFQFNSSKVSELIELLVDMGLSVVPAPSIIDMPDEDDRMFYEVAKACDASLVTGSSKHFPDEPFIFTAAEYLKAVLQTSNEDE